MPAKQNKSGFTLVELLVVISIISLLVSILLPALTKAREQAKAAICLSNLRQFNIAAQMYAHNYADHYPIAYRFEMSASISIAYSWDFHVITDWTLGGQKTLEPGFLWQGEKQVTEVQQCPSFRGLSNAIGNLDPYTGYNYNVSYIAPNKDDGSPSPIQFTTVKSPAQCVIFGDGEFSGGANKYMRAPLVDNSDPTQGDKGFTARSSGTQGFRHNHATNAAYCDGHVAPVRQRYTNTTDITAVAENTGFLSEDNSAYDLR